jgi:two-component system, OmpR family, response regulator
MFGRGGISSNLHCPASNVSPMRILVVEDEPAMAGLLQRALEKEGHAVDLATNGTDALWSATEVDYDAIVLDAMIPAPDGFEVCRQLRERKRWAPIIMLTARDGVEDRVRGLDAGADDYLTKPFALAELFARLRSVSRRDPAPRPAALIVPDPLGDLVVDPATHGVQRGETAVDLSPTEFALLSHLARNQGRVVSRSEIIEHVWDFAYDGTSNVVDVYVRYVRDKIDRPFGTSTIETVRGVGYVIRTPRETPNVNNSNANNSNANTPDANAASASARS